MATELTFLQQLALSAQIGFYIVTGISLIVTGILAAVKFRSFSRPFINVSLEVSRAAAPFTRRRSATVLLCQQGLVTHRSVGLGRRRAEMSTSLLGRLLSRNGRL